MITSVPTPARRWSRSPGRRTTSPAASRDCAPTTRRRRPTARPQLPSPPKRVSLMPERTCPVCATYCLGHGPIHEACDTQHWPSQPCPACVNVTGHPSIRCGTCGQPLRGGPEKAEERARHEHVDLWPRLPTRRGAAGGLAAGRADHRAGPQLPTAHEQANPPDEDLQMGAS